MDDLVEQFPTPDECSSCKFWFRASLMYGTCRRFPPQIARPQMSAIDTMPRTGVNPGEGFIGDFPYTTSYDWCGEWQLRPEHWTPIDFGPTIESMRRAIGLTEESEEQEGHRESET